MMASKGDHIFNADQFADHPYGGHIEWVPTAALRRHREYDRRTEPRIQGVDELTPLKESIAREGITSPLILSYGQKDRRAWLSEGNHRLAAAEDLGISHVPVRVNRVQHTAGRGAPVKGVEENPYGYVPADLRPSQIGLPTRGNS